MTAHDNVEGLTALFDQDLFARSLGIKLVRWSAGSATVAATPDASHCNFVGSVHGGYLLSAADVAMSVASNSLGRVCVATSIDIHYHRAVRAADELEVTASEVSRGRKLASYRVELLHEGALVASATGVTYRTSQWHLGADAWSDAWRADH